MSVAAAPEYYELVEIHGRTFQRYSIQNNIYHIPVDEEEEDRLELQHRIFLEIFDNRLFFPPLQYPRRILDCGYGQGNWAVNMAQTYHESHITAIDLYPADLPEEPDNLECEIWNLNEPLTPTYKTSYYDLINSRCVGPGIHKDRWRGYIRDLVRLLRHGGWVQCIEYYFNIQSDSGRLREENALYRWGQGYRAAMEEDRDPRVGGSLGEKLRHVGLTDVHTRTYHVPIGDWPTDPKQKQIGIWNRDNMDELLDSHVIWPFTARLGWSAEQVTWLTTEAKQEMQDASLKLYIPLYVAWGRRR